MDLFLHYVFTVAFIWQFQKYNPGQSAKHPLEHRGCLCKNTIDRFRSASAHAKRGKHLLSTNYKKPRRTEI